MNARLFLLAALSMSLGWRIRGQFGHELGAAIPGALGALAVALAAGRADWLRRAPALAFFAAIGWGFGGSIAYMKVVGYAHSSDSMTVLYGYAGIFLIGFLWASLGGAGFALAAEVDDKRLSELFGAAAAVFAAWFLKDIFIDVWETRGGASLDWHDSDWLEAAAALLGIGALAAVRRRIDFGASLALHLAVGWWAGFLLLVVALGLRLSPPRGDNWAGVIGIFAGLMVFCYRHRLASVACMAVAAGVLGAIGFSFGQTIKLSLIATGEKFDWHAAMEWIQGLFFGLAFAAAAMPLARRAPQRENKALPSAAAGFALFFLLWILPYYNFRKSPERWMREFPAFTGDVYGLPAVGSFVPSGGFVGWVEILFVVLAASIFAIFVAARRRALAWLPADALGRAQLLYAAFAWSFAFISFTSEIAQMDSAKFMIQFAITLNAVIATGIAVGLPAVVSAAPAPAPGAEPNWRRRIAQWAAAGLIAWAVMSFAGWNAKRALFGGAFAGYFPNNHIRFGPENTDHLK